MKNNEITAGVPYGCIKRFLNAYDLCIRFRLFGNDALLYTYLYCVDFNPNDRLEYIYEKVPIMSYDDFLNTWHRLEVKGLVCRKNNKIYMFLGIGGAIYNPFED